MTVKLKQSVWLSRYVKNFSILFFTDMSDCHTLHESLSCLDLPSHITCSDLDLFGRSQWPEEIETKSCICLEVIRSSSKLRMIAKPIDWIMPCQIVVSLSYDLQSHSGSTFLGQLS